jgi:hypothetical protein
MGRRRVESVELPNGVETKRVRGHVYRYWNPHRGTDREGERKKLAGDPTATAGSEQWKLFYRELEAAMAKEPSFAAGSVGALIELWEKSDEFTRNAPSTQANYTSCLGRIAAAWGEWGANELAPQAVMAGRDALKETPGMANELLSVGRTMYGWGIPLGHCQSNPFDAVRPFEMKDRGQIPWPLWVTEYVISKAPPDLVRMVKFGQMTCQRQSDLIRMGPPHRDRIGIWCRPVKTKRKRRKAFVIPLATVDVLLLDRWAETPVTFTNTRWLKPIDRFRPDLYLYSPKGAPYTKTSLRARYNRWLKTENGKLLCKKWQEWVGEQARKYQWDMDEEDWKHPTIHGLRGTGILLRRGRGCNNEQISNDIGMSMPIVERYMRFKDQVAVAEAGRFKLIGGSGP